MKEALIMLIKFLGVILIYYFFLVRPILDIGIAFDQGTMTGILVAKSAVLLLTFKPLFAGYASAVGLVNG